MKKKITEEWNSDKVEGSEQDFEDLINDDERVKNLEFKNQKAPDVYNQVAADGHTLDKEKWNTDFKQLKEQADEALEHLQKIEDSLK